MDRSEILAFMTQVETEDIDPICVAEVYAAAIDDMQSRITPQDLQKLLLLGAAMYRNSIKGKHVELQLPVQEGDEDQKAALETASFSGVLH